MFHGISLHSRRFLPEGAAIGPFADAPGTHRFVSLDAANPPEAAPEPKILHKSEILPPGAAAGNRGKMATCVYTGCLTATDSDRMPGAVTRAAIWPPGPLVHGISASQKGAGN